jgi:hypothetical protein
MKKALWTTMPKYRNKRIPEKRPKRIGMSKSMRERLKEYQKVRDIYLRQHPVCEACLKLGLDQPRLSEDLHHKRGRRKFLSDPEFFAGVCRAHHAIIHDNPEWSYRNGWLIKR